MNATSRKRVSGEIRDKERTILKLIHAVGEIIKTEGYTALGVNRIAKKAEVDKKLIYRYFNSVNNLIETYIKTKDYWIGLSANMDEIVAGAQIEKGKPLIKAVLRAHFNYFLTDLEMQRIIIWELSEKNKFLKQISAKREEFGNEVFKLIEPYFEDTKVDIRATLALQVSGIIFIILQAKANGSPFCGIDINNPGDLNRLLDALDGIVDLAYQQIGQ
ncbi:TetR/AcrR family transcriptional regulator [Pedobacter sp. GR22-6]|uniref:TetR/AcrR family transcriptional regulator n=1 Tax=Pedobacter sp. GR22-6 TaxID=3127957 RepID=UPI00307EF9DA